MRLPTIPKGRSTPQWRTPRQRIDPATRRKAGNNKYVQRKKYRQNSLEIVPVLLLRSLGAMKRYGREMLSWAGPEINRRLVGLGVLPGPITPHGLNQGLIDHPVLCGNLCQGGPVKKWNEKSPQTKLRRFPCFHHQSAMARHRKVTAWERDTTTSGLKVSWPVPLVMPFATAQVTASA